MKLFLSPAAIFDLQSIASYTFETWGEDQEKRYVSGLWKKFEEIRVQPEIHRLRDELANGCRSARHGKHVIFFRWETERIVVIRVLHEAMDFRTHLQDDPL